MIGPAARFFRGINIAFGVTTISVDATAAEERKFVAAWIGIIAFVLTWCALIVFWFVSS